MKKRMLILILAVVMVVTLLPAMALAAGNVASVTFDGNTTNHATIDAAWEKAISYNTTAEKKATVTLLADCAAAATLTNSEDYIVLNVPEGIKLTAKGPEHPTDYPGIEATGGELEIIGAGEITRTDSRGYSTGTIYINGGKVTVDGPTISCYAGTNGVAVHLSSSGEFHLISGNIVSSHYAMYFGNTGNNHSKLYLYSGTIEGQGRKAVMNGHASASGVIICYSESPLILKCDTTETEKIFSTVDSVKLNEDVASIKIESTMGTFNEQTSVPYSAIKAKLMYIYTVEREIARINASSSPSAGGSITGNGTHEKNASVTLKATPNTGYTFVNWTEGGNVVSTDATYTFTATEDRDLVANFEPITYDLLVGGVQVTGANLVIDNNDTNLITSGSATYDPKNNTLTLDNFNYSGACYRYYNDDDIGAAIFAYGIDLTIKLVGNNVIENTSDCGEGIFVLWNHMTDEGGDLTILDADETNEGKDLTITTADEGWYCDGISATNLEINGCNIEIDAPAPYSYGIGADEDLTIENSVIDTNAYFSGILANYVTTIKGSTVTAESASNAGIILGTYTGENQVTIEDSTISSKGKAEGMMMLCKSVTIKNSTVTADSDAYGIALGYGSFLFGGNCETFKIINSTVTSTGDIAAYALDDPATTFIIDNSVVYAGDEADGELVTDPETITYVNKYVRIEPVPVYTVTATANPTEGGTVSGGGSYTEGTAVTLTATANTGYSFVNWTENGSAVSTNATYSFSATENRTLVANFALNTYTVSISATPAAGGTVSGGGTYNHGATVTLTATPNTGYRFVKWTKDGTEVSTDATYTFTATENAEYVANFEQISSPRPSGGSSAPTYPVVENKGETPDGTVKFSSKYAAPGSTVTVTVTPDKYYGVEKVIVRDAGGKEIPTTKNADGTYSFQMPYGKVTVEAVYVWENPFVDVAEETFYIDAVEWALKNGITEGASETTFSPVASCTRAQMVTFLWRAAGCPEPTAKDCSFTDVDEDSYYGKAVLWALEKGITNGTDDGSTFSPDAECSRAQMAAFLCRMAAGKAAGDKSSFVDVNADAYYAEPVQWAFENGITEGTGGGKYSPNAVCTRGQMVTFLYRYFID